MKMTLVLICVIGAPTVAIADKEFFDPFEGAAPFSAAVRVGDILYLSGMLGTKDREIVDGGIAAETRQTLSNIATRLSEHGLTMADVVKCSVFLSDIADFGAMNTEYMQAFLPPRPTRTTVAVSGLALNAKIEIECIAAF